MSRTSTNTLIKTTAVAASVIFLYASVLAKLGVDWWSDENYSHGLLVPFVIGFILWGEREKLAEASTGASVCSNVISCHHSSPKSKR